MGNSLGSHGPCLHFWGYLRNQRCTELHYQVLPEHHAGRRALSASCLLAADRRALESPLGEDRVHRRPTDGRWGKEHRILEEILVWESGELA